MFAVLNHFFSFGLVPNLGKMKIKFTLLFIAALLGRQPTSSNELKIIDTGGFEIEVPANWQYKKRNGFDSFIGSIRGSGVDLDFDMSGGGFANHLIPSENEFIHDQDYKWMPKGIPYSKPGVIYTGRSDVKAARERIMKEKGITDTALVKVEPFQSPKVEIIKDGFNYRAVLTYRDTTVNVVIDIPEEIKNHLIEIDTIDNYRRKIIRPRSGKRGMTGIYLEDLSSGFNFNLSDNNLSAENQEKAIMAFKSIKFKRERLRQN